ncbi:unnamed protein product [Phytophthora fragariaefolia]|uniref:Unnamed protein product n=1 Tax=Phytophthora fragariaefolia TaxID=1490495 RepID=A0A9W6Y098_9STRA|nr:unnamed protein product [Phytophthora fragariaefolia]
MAEKLREFGEYVSKGSVPTLAIPTTRKRKETLQIQAESSSSNVSSNSESEQGSLAGNSLTYLQRDACGHFRFQRIPSHGSDESEPSISGLASFETVVKAVGKTNTKTKNLAVKTHILSKDKPRNLAVSTTAKHQYRSRNSSTNEPVKTKTKLISFAVKAVARTKITKGMSRTDTNELGDETNELGEATNGLGDGTNQLEASQGRLVVRKRSASSNNSEVVYSSKSDNGDCKFNVCSNGEQRPRKDQEETSARGKTKIRMERSKVNTKALAQGTLVPVKDFALVRRTLASCLNVTDAYPVLDSIESVDALLWKKPL